MFAEKALSVISGASGETETWFEMSTRETAKERVSALKGRARLFCEEREAPGLFFGGQARPRAQAECLRTR